MTKAQTSSLVSRWQPHFSGPLLLPDHSEFAQARRVWNGMIDRSPAIIARCSSSQEVSAAVRLAVDEGLHVSVRGGGHNVAGSAVCRDGLMIDLSRMKRITIDAERREAIAEPGVLWGELDRAAEYDGLATTGGQVSHTGIAGLTLGGGFGWLMGKHGSVCDNLLSVEMVLAGGDLVCASETENPDLFWAVRGAGANFGVVTSFRYRLHPISTVLAGFVLHPRAQATELFARYRDFLPGTPDELSTTFAFLNLSDGSPAIGIVVVWSGSLEKGTEVLAPLRTFGSPLADTIQPMPYPAAQSMLDAFVPAGARYYWKSNFVGVPDPALIRVLESGADRAPSTASMVLLFEIKGEIRRVPREVMAFDHRDHRFEMSIVAEWTDPEADAANIEWTRDVWTQAQPFVSTAVYANHMTADESPARVRAAYGPEKLARLSRLKARYDPDNLFCSHHKIPLARD